MHRVFAALMLASGVALTASAAGNFIPRTTSPLARAVMEGVILGSNPWPSTPADIQARLQLRAKDQNLIGAESAPTAADSE
jgi:hypothetical protein